MQKVRLRVGVHRQCLLGKRGIGGNPRQLDDQTLMVAIFLVQRSDVAIDPQDVPIPRHGMDLERVFTDQDEIAAVVVERAPACRCRVNAAVDGALQDRLQRRPAPAGGEPRGPAAGAVTVVRCHQDRAFVQHHRIGMHELVVCGVRILKERRKSLVRQLSAVHVKLVRRVMLILADVDIQPAFRNGHHLQRARGEHGFPCRSCTSADK